MSEDLRRAAIDLYDRYTHGGIDRRTFMAEIARLTGGAAAASALIGGIAARADAAPLVAANDRRLRTEELDWEVRPGRRLRLYRARPASGRGTRPAVIVIHENRGLNEHIRDVARRAAVAGYDAYAPDFLTVAGGTPADQDRARTLIGELNMPDTVADAAGLVSRLAEPRGARNVGAVGFCWGGAMVHRLAVAAGPRLAAGASFYGPAPAPAEAARVSADMLVILAERDQRVNTSAGPYVEALRAAGKSVRAITYPGTDHAFHNDTSAERYNRAAAEQAWAETLALFRRALR